MKAVRDSHETGDNRRAVFLLALHAVNGCPDAETLDDIAALVEAAFKPTARRFGMTEDDNLRTLRQEIAMKRKDVDAFCRWCSQPVPRGRTSRYCSDACAREHLGENPEEEETR